MSRAGTPPVPVASSENVTEILARISYSNQSGFASIPRFRLRFIRQTRRVSGSTKATWGSCPRRGRACPQHGPREQPRVAPGDARKGVGWGAPPHFGKHPPRYSNEFEGRHNRYLLHTGRADGPDDACSRRQAVAVLRTGGVRNSAVEFGSAVMLVFWQAI